MEVFHAELGEFYTAFQLDREPRLAALPIQYGDFAEWQRSAAHAAEIELQLEYWRRQLKDLPSLALPYDHPRPKMLSYRGAHLEMHLPASLCAALHAFSRREHATLYITSLSVFAILLGMFTGQDDVVVGTPVAGRNRVELEPLIGLFLNTIVLRIDLSGDPTVRGLVARVREIAVEAYANQDVPFDRLVEELRPERDLGRNPLFQVLFQVFKPRGNWSGSTQADAGRIPFERGAAILDLCFHLWEAGSGIGVLIEYSTELFEETTIRRLYSGFLRLLESAVAQPDRRLSELSVHSSDGLKEVLRDWQGPIQSRSLDITLYRLFQHRVSEQPEGLAVIEGDARLTYRALDELAEHFAGQLQHSGVRPGDRVAIYCVRSTAMVAAMLAALRLNASFVPLDPGHPLERLCFMLDDSGATALVTTTGEASRLGSVPCPVLLIDEDNHPRMPSVAIDAHPLDAAYVIYTSGSTGRPKGVVATNRSTLNRFAWMWQDFPFEPGDVCCQKTAVTFVDSIWETFGPLLRGVPLVIIPDRVLQDPSEFVSLLSQHGVTRLLVVPSLLRVVLDTNIELASRLPQLRWCFVSGERLTGELAQLFRQRLPNTRLVNLYGSSEVAGDITYAVLTDDEPPGDVPIGWPISNCRAYVLDRLLRIVPPGVIGDLWVAGPNLARGYLGRPALTAERFVPDPFSSNPGERMYATGDRARQRPDGCIEFVGRLDQQVKLRGYRIELGEVEAVLHEHSQLRHAVANVHEDHSGGTLVAFVEPRELPLNIEELRRFAAARLPSYMVPSVITCVPSLPMLPSGKLDRVAIGKLDKVTVRRADAVAPRSDSETAVAAIWTELLGVTEIGVADSFFEVGGHSLLATRLVTRIRDRMGVELSLPEVFLHPTIEEQATIIEARLVREIETLSDEEARLLLSKIGETAQ
jgi:amino acid adenylation domain-containing protein